MGLTDKEKLSVAIGFLEIGHENSINEINNFKRCEKCKTGYFVSATSHIELIKCPYCGNTQYRTKTIADRHIEIDSFLHDNAESTLSHESE